jgi:hypothetical protein
MPTKKPTRRRNPADDRLNFDSDVGQDYWADQWRIALRVAERDLGSAEHRSVWAKDATAVAAETVNSIIRKFGLKKPSDATTRAYAEAEVRAYLAWHEAAVMPQIRRWNQIKKDGGGWF